MTFNFFDWTGTFPAVPLTKALPRAPRPRLVARWRRGADGRIVCRWVRVDPVAFPN